MDNKPYSDGEQEQEPLRDVNSMARLRIQDEDIEGHHTDRWQQQAMYVDIHMPSERKHRSRRRHRRASTDPANAKVTTDTAAPTPTSPSEHVQQLLQVAEGEDDERPAHEIFCELSELRPVPESVDYEWREMARWVKFEEDVEEGGERWSKPHVASLSLHSLFEVRKSIVAGLVKLDMDASSMREISEIVVDQMVAISMVTSEQHDKVIDLLLARHRHQHERKHDTRSTLPIIRSLADIGRRGSDRRIEDHRPSIITATALGETSMRDVREIDQQDAADIKFNEHFAKKLAPGSEAASILVGDVEGLSQPAVAFVRLSKAILLGNMLEVPIPVRFIFILLQPTGTPKRCHEIGRAFGTLMSDEVFHDVAYKAKNADDLLAGVDEFLEQVTVLPPGEWDPTIRIEPPKSVPSQEARKVSKLVVPNGTLPNGTVGGGNKSGADGTHGDEEELESHHIEPTLERTGRLFGGLIADVKRKVPWYLSDFRDALHPQIIASAFFMFFACLTPTVMFGALLGAATGQNMAAMECLLSSSVCGIMYHLFSGQPLMIIGPTGPMLVIESIIFNVCRGFGWPYLTFRMWIGLWMMVALLLIVMFDLSSLVKYITRFTEESFATLIAVIFIYEAIHKLFKITNEYPVDLDPDLVKDYNCTCFPPNVTLSPWMNESTVAMDSVLSTTPLYFAPQNDTNATIINWASLSPKHCEKLGGVAEGTGCDTPVYVPDVFFFSCLLFIGTFVLCMALKHFRNTRFFPNAVRVLLSDFAVLISIALMVLVDFFVGLHTPKLEVPHDIRPTNPQRDGWLISPFAGPWWTIIVAVLPALLATILVFMDQQITAVIVNRKEHKLKKGCGYHLDLLMIGIQIGLCSVLGTPWLVASTVPAVNHVRSLTKESESVAPGERPKFLGVREQRVTGVTVFIFVGLAAFMASVLQFIPMPVLYGISLFMGVASLAGIQLVQRLLIILMPVKYQPDYIFLRHVPLKRVNLFTAIQFIFLVIMGVIEMIEVTSMLFPLMVLALCFVRKALDWIFSQQELRWLDDLMPDAHKREKEDKKKKKGSTPLADDADGSDEAKVIEMGDSGTVTIPIKNGKPLMLPASKVTYDPQTHKLNISEEMSKTAIWQIMVSESQSNLAHGNGSPSTDKRRMSDDESSNGGRGKKEPVTFRIDEDETEPLMLSSPTVTLTPPSPINSARTKQSDKYPV